MSKLVESVSIGSGYTLRLYLLEYWFNIPGMKTVDLCFYDTPVKHGVKVFVSQLNGLLGRMLDPALIIGEKKEEVVSDPCLDAILEKHIGKTLYMTVEYED